jgi:hypothetical protein
MSEISSQHKSELDKYYHPKPALVHKLPNPKEVSDFSKVFIKNSDGTYNIHEMVSGVWVTTATNVKQSV